MFKKICVIGAGGTGQSFAANMKQKGHYVCLFDQNIETLASLKNGIELTGNAGTGLVILDKLTNQIQDALENVNLIVVCTIANSHEYLAKLVAPYLKSKQCVFISAGNAGSYIFYKEYKKIASDDSVIFGELEGNFYPCRSIGEAKVYIHAPLAQRYISAYPANKTPQLILCLEGILEAVPASNIFEACLNSPNVVIHLAASILNLGEIEKSAGKYYLYKQGLTPHIMHFLDAIEAEKNILFRTYAWQARSPMPHMDKVYNSKDYPELEGFRNLIGPTDARHRYITEDAFSTMPLILSLAELAQIELPLIKSLVTIASGLHQTDYYVKGRTLRNLAIEVNSIEQLNHILEKGYNYANR